MSQEPRVVQAVPILPVSDLEATLAFFRDVLGWEKAFAWPEDAPYYAGVCSGGAMIHLNARTDGSAIPPRDVYHFVLAVDAMAEAITARGGTLEIEPETLPYGMRECAIRTPDDHRLIFGQGVDLPS